LRQEHYFQFRTKLR